LGRKYAEVGLSEKPLTLEELESLLVMFESRILDYIRRRLGRRVEDLDLVINAELSEEGRVLRLTVDVRASGRQIAPISYDEVLAEAIEDAARQLESELKKRRRSSSSS
jgi:ribosome-associated translation inhibitor RaiA